MSTKIICDFCRSEITGLHLGWGFSDEIETEGYLDVCSDCDELFIDVQKNRLIRRDRPF